MTMYGARTTTRTPDNNTDKYGNSIEILAMHFIIYNVVKVCKSQLR